MKLVTIAIASVAAGAAIGFFYQLVIRGASNNLRPGDVVQPETPVTRIPNGTVQGQGQTGCYGEPRWEWHLRPNETNASSGQTYPAGERLQILSRGSLTRGGASIYRVRVLRNAQEGWCFLFGFELSGACNAAPIAPPQDGLENHPAQSGARGPFGGSDEPVSVPPLVIVGRN